MRGTKVTLRNVRASPFHQVISAAGEAYVGWPAPGQREANPGQIMNEFVRSFTADGNLSVTRLAGREQILWQLGMSTPVEYLEDGPVATVHRGEASGIIESLRGRNAGYNFHLWYDGVQVRKPILLPTPDPGVDPGEPSDIAGGRDVGCWPINIASRTEDGRDVVAVGYILYQPYRVIPAEMRGILPRLNSIAIGSSHDSTTFIRTLKGERPLFRIQVSGELYIGGGLDEAVNLDRSGFLEIDTAFRVLSEELNGTVRNVLREASRIALRRRQRRQESAATGEIQATITQAMDQVRSLGIDYDLRIMASIQTILERALPDFQTVCAYPSDSAEVVIDHSSRTILLAPEAVDPRWVATIVLIDPILGERPDGPIVRRRFADALRRISIG